MKLAATMPTRHYASMVYLKAAYLTVLSLLGEYGYQWAASPALRCVRAQIRNPKEEIIDRFAFNVGESTWENGAAINTRHETPCWAVKLGDCVVVLPPDTCNGTFYAESLFTGNDKVTLGGGPLWFPVKFGRTRVGRIAMREDFDPKSLLGTDDLFGKKGKLAVNGVERECIVVGYQGNTIAVLFTDRLR